MPRRFQFSLRALLVAMLVVGAFFAGMALQKRFDKPRSHSKISVGGSGKMRVISETMVLRDGSRWDRDFGEDNVNAKEMTSVARESGQLTRRPTQHPLFTRRPKD